MLPPLFLSSFHKLVVDPVSLFELAEFSRATLVEVVDLLIKCLFDEVVCFDIGEVVPVEGLVTLMGTDSEAVDGG